MQSDAISLLDLQPKGIKKKLSDSSFALCIFWIVCMCGHVLDTHTQSHMSTFFNETIQVLNPNKGLNRNH